MDKGNDNNKRVRYFDYNDTNNQIEIKPLRRRSSFEQSKNQSHNANYNKHNERNGSNKYSHTASGLNQSQARVNQSINNLSNDNSIKNNVNDKQNNIPLNTKFNNNAHNNKYENQNNFQYSNRKYQANIHKEKNKNNKPVNRNIRNDSFNYNFNPNINNNINETPDKIKNSKNNYKFFASYSPLYKMILVACIVVFIFSSFMLINYFINASKQKKALDEAKTLYNTEADNTPTESLNTATPATLVPSQEPKQKAKSIKATDTPLPEQTRSIPLKYASNYFNRVNEKFFSLLDINKDIVGWIKLGSLVDQPVVKRDNKYYLTHNYKRENNPAGAIFLDEKSNINSPPENLIVHGHNMKNGSMFGKLLHYKIDLGIKFFVENSTFTFDTLFQDSQYVIFSVMEIETDPKSPSYFPFMAYDKFRTDKQAMEFINKVKSRSIFDVPIDVKPDDSLITLATCSQTTESSRILVVARRIRDGESLTSLKDAVYKTVRLK